MNCETTYTYNAGTLQTTDQVCELNDNLNSSLFLIEFVIVFYIFITLMNYASGFVSRLTK
jgi:hypothetical protein